MSMTIPHTVATTPSGETLVIMSKPEFDKLAALAARAMDEDARDSAAYDAAKAEMAHRNGETLTNAEMADLLAAASPLAFWRRKRGLTQTELSAQVGTSQAHVSDLENARRTPSLTLASDLARVLRVSVDDLIITAD